MLLNHNDNSDHFQSFLQRTSQSDVTSREMNMCQLMSIYRFCTIYGNHLDCFKRYLNQTQTMVREVVGYGKD